MVLFKMVLIFLVLCSLLMGDAAYHQDDYKIVHHRMELITYSHAYGYNTKASFVPLNRTARAMNFSLQVFRLASNEYRLFPLALSFDLYQAQIDNTYGSNDVAKYSNSPFFCPIEKGYYYINKYRPDESKFPPYLVPGDYKLVINITYTSENLAEVHWYGSVKKIENLWR